MPKMKTNRSAAKRFKFTKNGKIKKAATGMRHKLSKKTPKAKRNLGGTSVLTEADMKEVIKLLPYGRR